MPATMSIVELESQALLITGTHIVKNIVAFIIMSGGRLGPLASCSLLLLFFLAGGVLKTGNCTEMTQESVREDRDISGGVRIKRRSRKDKRRRNDRRRKD